VMVNTCNGLSGRLPSSLGVDFGTSGVRSCLVEAQSQRIIHECSFTWESLGTSSNAASAESWRSALLKIITSVPSEVRLDVRFICCSGTSSSALIYDASSATVTRAPRMYNFNVLSDVKDSSLGIDCGKAALALISEKCPAGSATNAATSTLAKLLSWHLSQPLGPSERLLHQADYCSFQLTDGSAARSDWHNALKLGFDVHTLCYPDWLLALLDSQGLSRDVLPAVGEPGGEVGKLGTSFVNMGYSRDCAVVAGTTDSIAAFLAAGATRPGQAVTSLGSTLAIKLLSRVPVADDSRGIYSHRLGDQWLVGGASNVGCAIFRQEGFSDDELRDLSANIVPNGSPPPHAYYPLLRPGERFPVNDPKKQPLMDPRPPVVSRSTFLHGLLHSIAEIEREGYAALEELGADRVTEVLTAGGGSKNNVWTTMRSKLLNVPVRRAGNSDAAFGAARLGLSPPIRAAQ